MQFKSLKEVHDAIPYGTRRKYLDKCHTFCDYFRVYDELFSPIREKVTDICELGVGYGTVIYLWRMYFENAIFHGIDRSEAILRYGKKPRTKLYAPYDIGDREKISNLLKEINTKFDIVIDDAAHEDSKRITAFECFWPYIKPGGYYIVEDCAVSYWPKYNDSNVRVIDYFKNILDELSFYGNDPNIEDLRIKRAGLTLYQNTIDFIEFRLNLIIIKKRLMDLYDR